ncbi:MAG TPA: response regulator [Oligoflexus sp.]|uniref:response regulator n=1 Tax=Oligoflexus sp. TaxID=1971216 RepID=UPI002D81046A|nr:response regulator [Oligoflexus sp.]HET9237412.1 response regulator [Oligoflexus sp.]
MFSKKSVVRERWIMGCLLLASFVVFVLDSRAALGVAVWIPYIAFVALSLFTGRPGFPIVLAGLTSLGIILGFFKTTDEELTRSVVIINRSFGAVTLWLVAFVVYRFLIAQRDLARQQEETETAHARLQKQDWVNQGRARISEAIRGDMTIETMTTVFLRTVAQYLDAALGSFYLLQPTQELERVATYCYAVGSETKKTFKLGEGLIGEAAVSQRMLELKNPPESYLVVESSLGRTSPAHLVVIPLVFNDHVVGVLELASLRELNAEALHLLEYASEYACIRINAALKRIRLQELLLQTQKQAEELQAQQEELHATNEELSQQARALMQAQAQLEMQQTALEESNAELEQQHAHLEDQKKQLESANRNLREAKLTADQKARELETASRYKSEFLANMSHELRTPLNSILLLGQMLQRNKAGNLTSDQLDSARMIQAAGEDLLNLINDVLDLSRVEAGKLELVRDELLMSSLKKSIERSFQSLAQSKGIGLRCLVTDTCPTMIVSDPQRVEQIVKNFVSNAIKFTEKGAVTVRLKAAGPEHPGYALAIEVQDTGIGIPKDKFEVIFEAFRQVDGSIGRRYGGTGLGLSISRDLCGLLQGHILIQSEEGLGSTFTLLLPQELPESISPAAVPQPKETPPAREKPAPLVPQALREEFHDDRLDLKPSDQTILVIDDDAHFAQMLRELVHERGFKCLLSDSGERGIQDAMEFLPDGIVLDLGLPGISGMEVLEKLKSDPHTRPIPVHVISGSDYSRNALYLGAIGYLMKPVSLSDVQLALQRIENLSEKAVKNILIVEDDSIQLHAMTQLIQGSDSVHITGVTSGRKALEELRRQTFDCMVLDLKLPDMTGLELLEKMSREEGLGHPPVIVYTGQRLSRDEEQRIRRYAEAIVVKGARSMERLLDETTLFLHRIEDNLPVKSQALLKEARLLERSFADARILLVDDDMRNLFALVHVLEDRGAMVITARNGQEALDVLDKDPSINIVLMDVMMPVMDGLEAMQRIRQNKLWKQLPIISLTAKAMKGDQEKCLAAGANDYLAKPVDMERLVSLIRVWLAPQGF